MLAAHGSEQLEQAGPLRAGRWFVPAPVCLQAERYYLSNSGKGALQTKEKNTKENASSS